MERNKIAVLTKSFDSIAKIEDETVEFWYARELQQLLGYSTWENFEKTIFRAIESIKTTKISPSDHFREVTKMVKLGSSSEREVTDYICNIYLLSLQIELELNIYE